MSFSTRNLGGGGETLSVSYNGGKFSKNVSVGFTEPYVFDLPYSFSASVSNGIGGLRCLPRGHRQRLQAVHPQPRAVRGRAPEQLVPQPALGLLHHLLHGLQLPPDPHRGRPQLLLPRPEQPAHLHLQPEPVLQHGEPPVQAHPGHAPGLRPGVRRLAVRRRQALPARHLGLRQVRQRGGPAHLRHEPQLRLPPEPGPRGAAALRPLPARRREQHPRLPLRPGGQRPAGQQRPAGGGGRQQAVHRQPGIPVQDRGPVPARVLLRRRQRLGQRHEDLQPGSWCTYKDTANNRSPTRTPPWCGPWAWSSGSSCPSAPPRCA